MGTLGERLGCILERQGFSSSRALARAVRLSGAQIAFVLNGERGLSAQAAHAIATAAVVDLRRFVTGEVIPDGAAKEHARPALSPDPCPHREQAPWPSWRATSRPKSRPPCASSGRRRNGRSGTGWPGRRNSSDS